jgi:hypothetical protein
MKTIKYLKCRVGSCSNCVIELNLGMLILTRFVINIFFVMLGSRKLMLNIFKNGSNNISETSCGISFNRVIELNQKMLILERFVMKNYFFHVRIKMKIYHDDK